MAVSQGVMQKSFVSAIDFLDQREIDPNLYDQARDREFTDIMKIIGRYKPCTTGQFNYHNFVNNDAYELSTISAVTSGNGTGLVVFTVSTATGFPRIGDIIMTSNANNAGKMAVIQAVTRASGTATITAREVNNGAFYVVVGDTVTYNSNAFPEKSSNPTNRRYAVTKYFNLIQIFREYDEITDVQKVAKIEFGVGSDMHILPYQYIQKVTKLQGDISAAMIGGVKSTTQFGDQNPTLADSTNVYGIQTTGGLDWYTTTYGISDGAAVLGTFGFTEVDDIIDNWLANKAPNDQMGYMSSKAKRLLDKFFKNLGSSGVTSARMVIDGRTLDLEVDHVSYGNFELDLIPLKILDHPQIFGPLPAINGSIYWVPKDKISVVGGGQEPRMQIRYTPSPFEGRTANGSNNGFMTEWRTGALAGTPTSSEVSLRTDWYAAQGLEVLGAKHFQKYRVI